MRSRGPLFAPGIAAALFVAGALAFPGHAAASLLITIDKASQHMVVALNDMPVFDWPVSTGMRGHDTPVGQFKPFRMEKDHFSREWDDAPMPHSVFFTQEGHAIHGSFDVKHLGRPASHGCVRLAPKNAATLFALVKQEGMANTRVVLTGTIPGGGGAPVARRAPGIDPYGDNAGPGFGGNGYNDGFTGALPPASRRNARVPREERGPAYFDGRNYDERPGRTGRRTEAERRSAPPYAQRYYYDNRPEPRPRGLPFGWNN